MFTFIGEHWVFSLLVAQILLSYPTVFAAIWVLNGKSQQGVNFSAAEANNFFWLAPIAGPLLVMALVPMAALGLCCMLPAERFNYRLSRWWPFGRLYPGSEHSGSGQVIADRRVPQAAVSAASYAERVSAEISDALTDRRITVEWPSAGHGH